MKAKIAVRRKTVKDILVENNLLAEKQINDAIEESKRTGMPLQQVIVKLNFLDKAQLLLTLSRGWGVRAVDLNEIEIDPEVVRLIPETAAWRHHALPFAKEENVLFVAMSDPRDIFAIEDIQLRTGFEVQAYLSLPEDIEKNLDKIYHGEEVSETLQTILSTVKTEEGGLSVGKQVEEEKVEITEVDVSTPEVEKLVNAIILGAIQQKASDIHIEPQEKKLLVRYRIDGILHEAPFSPPYSFKAAIIAKLKIMTQSMDITEHRKPQDGRIQLTARGKPLELRVNIIPTVYGESCVMRILDRSSIMVAMDKLGFLQDTLEKFKASLSKPYGIILVCGPTGSGKSTTLYAALNFINKPDVKILTAENPVEYNLPGIIQLNINPEIQLDFAEALRAFLRQDPDIIMIGEIRDRETATIAMEAAMTGHLVLSTIHTNDAPSAVARLYEMGVYPFMISSTIECVLAQRLVRRICFDCKEQIPPEKAVLNYFKTNNIDYSQLKLSRGKGCPTCNNSGYKGRLGIYEFLQMTDEMRILTLKEFAAGPIRELAKKQGMRTLIQDGLIKVSQGITTIEEVLRVSQ